MVQVQSIREAIAVEPPHLCGLFSERFLGLLIVAVAPTIFWTGLICVVAAAYGSPLAIWAACSVSTLIFAFLICIWAAFTMAHNSETIEPDDCKQ